MNHELFSKPWCDAWRVALAKSESYRDAGKDWSDPLVLLDDGGEGRWRGVRAALRHGVPDAVRPATESDLESCPFVLSAGTEIWRKLLDCVDPRQLHPVVDRVLSGLRKVSRKARWPVIQS